MTAGHLETAASATIGHECGTYMQFGQEGLRRSQVMSMTDNCQPMECVAFEAVDEGVVMTSLRVMEVEHTQHWWSLYTATNSNTWMISLLATIAEDMRQLWDVYGATHGNTGRFGGWSVALSFAFGSMRTASWWGVGCGLWPLSGHFEGHLQ